MNAFLKSDYNEYLVRLDDFRFNNEVKAIDEMLSCEHADDSILIDSLLELQDSLFSELLFRYNRLIEDRQKK